MTVAARLDDAGATSRALFARLDPGAPPEPPSPEGPGGFRALVQPSDYCRGPWDPGLLHGGPVGGLVAWAAEQAADAGDEALCARLTLELLAGVPTEPLAVEATVIKPGRRARMTDVTVHAGDTLVARASTVWLQRAPGWDTEAGRRPPGPTTWPTPAPPTGSTIRDPGSTVMQPS